MLMFRLPAVLQEGQDLLQALRPRHGRQEERRLPGELRRALRQQSFLQLSQLQVSEVSGGLMLVRKLLAN